MVDRPHGTMLNTNQISTQVEIVVQMENHQFPELLTGINTAFTMYL